MFLHNVSVFFASPFLACPFSRGFSVGTQRASLRVARCGYPLICFVGKMLFQWHNFRPHPGPSVKISVLVSLRDDRCGMKM